MADNARIVTIDDANNGLNLECDKVASIEDGKQIANVLFQVLNTDINGIGLSANQIGMHKRVCVIRVKEPVYFINPVITPIESAGKFVYLETCLSMPRRVCRTERWKSIAIQADNIEGTTIYDVSHVHIDDIMENRDVLEITAIQHELDHLNGILMSHREYSGVKPIVVGHIPNRNEKVVIRKGDEIKEIKYKQLETYISQGWLYDKI